MIVISLVKCPPSLRGDLTKWFFEISTNVFVGIVSARVRDNIWSRIKNTCKSGRAVMVFTTNNEQGFDFRVHNGEWSTVDLDGIIIMKRPLPDRHPESKTGYSKASTYRRAKLMKSSETRKRKKIKTFAHFEYVVTDKGTMDIAQIEIADVKDGIIFNENIFIISENGVERKENFEKFLNHISDKTLVVENSERSLVLLNEICGNLGLDVSHTDVESIYSIAKRKLHNLRRYDLKTLMDYFEISRDSDSFSNVGVIIRIYENLKKSD